MKYFDADGMLSRVIPGAKEDRNELNRLAPDSHAQPVHRVCTNERITMPFSVRFAVYVGMVNS